MRQIQLSSPTCKIQQTQISVCFPKLANTQYPHKQQSSEIVQSMSFYNAIKSLVQPQKLNHMDTMSKIIKLIKMCIIQIQQYIKSVSLVLMDVQPKGQNIPKHQQKIEAVLLQVSSCLQILNNHSDNQKTITPMLARRFMTRIIQTLSILKNKYSTSSSEEPFTYDFLYKNSRNEMLRKMNNPNKLVASLVLGCYQQFSNSKKIVNQEIANVFHVSINNVLRIIRKFVQITRNNIQQKVTNKLHNNIQTHKQFNKNTISSSVMDRAYREASYSKKNKNNGDQNQSNIHKNATTQIQKSLSLYSCMNIDVQHLRSIVMQSKHHCVDLKDSTLQQNTVITKSIQIYSNNYEKWKQKLIRKKQKKLRKQKKTQLTNIGNKLNMGAVKLSSRSPSKKKKNINKDDIQNGKYRKLQKCTNQKILKECPSQPIKDRFRVDLLKEKTNFTRVSFAKSHKRNYLQVKPVTVTGDELMYTNQRCFKFKTCDKNQKIINQKLPENRNYLRDQQILQMVKGISKRNTNLLYRGFKLPIDRMAMIRRKSTSCKNDRLVTQ